MTEKADIDVMRIRPGCIQTHCPSLLNMAFIKTFFCRGEVVYLGSPPIIRKDINLKVVSKLVLKQLLDCDGSSDV